MSKLEDKVDLARVDVDKLPELAITYEVASIPHVIGFDKGARKSEFVGAVSKEQVAEFFRKL